MGWTLERPFSADYFGFTTVSLQPPSSLFRPADCRAEMWGRTEVGSPPSGALTWLFGLVFLCGEAAHVPVAVQPLFFLIFFLKQPRESFQFYHDNVFYLSLICGADICGISLRGRKGGWTVREREREEGSGGGWSSGAVTVTR